MWGLYAANGFGFMMLTRGFVLVSVGESVEAECYFDGGADAPLGADPFGEALASVEQASQETAAVGTVDDLISKDKYEIK